MERTTDTAKRAYICSKCLYKHQTIQRGSSHAVILDGMATYRLHHECADQAFPDVEEDEDEIQAMQESWDGLCDEHQYISGR